MSTQMGMVIDLERCQGCRACQVACKTENNTSRGSFWMNVFRYEEGEFPDTEVGFVPNPCHHCSDPSCAHVCPTTARHKRDDDGLVLTDYEICIGCRYCMIGCPYGVNYFQWRDPGEAQYGHEQALGNIDEWDEFADEEGYDEVPWEDTLYMDEQPMAGQQPKGKMSKCTFCVHRQDSGDADVEGTTACEEVCPINVIHFGDLNDPDSKPRQHLDAVSKQRWEMLEESQNESNLIFLGDQPGGSATSIEGIDSFKSRDEAVEADAERANYYSGYLGGDD